jgi:hypothetical protein
MPDRYGLHRAHVWAPRRLVTAQSRHPGASSPRRLVTPQTRRPAAFVTPAARHPGAPSPRRPVTPQTRGPTSRAHRCLVISAAAFAPAGPVAPQSLRLRGPKIPCPVGPPAPGGPARLGGSLAP